MELMSLNFGTKDTQAWQWLLYIDTFIRVVIMWVSNNDCYEIQQGPYAPYYADMNKYEVLYCRGDLLSIISRTYR